MNTPRIALFRCSPAVFVGLVLSLGLCLAGCPKGAGLSASGSQAATPDTWVVFEVVEAGTGNSLEATVWPSGEPQHFETLIEGDAGAKSKFYGLGRTDSGYALSFKAGGMADLQVWTPGHELEVLSVRLQRGENLLIAELKVAAVQDERVPERIRTEVLQSLPSQGPKSGS
jgi:hypothetical protein